MSKDLQALLKKSTTQTPESQARFFKTGPGEYSHHDKFLGITTPTLRTIAKQFWGLALDDIKILMQSQYNEERLLGLFILGHQYPQNPDGIYLFYVDHLDQVNNWNFVDASAHLIIGRHLFEKDKTALEDLAKSPNMWRRRVAIVATWYFIKQGQCDWTYKLAKMLLRDDQDLIHKAVGWMLREAGKIDVISLKNFLNEHPYMPRTMLRYAIEKFPKKERRGYLGGNQKT